jgi:hypothetical protein
MVVKDNQPSLAERLVSQPWSVDQPDDTVHDRGHGRIEKRSLWHLPVPELDPLPGFPSVGVNIDAAWTSIIMQPPRLSYRARG